MPDINVNKLSEALNTKADIDLNNTGVFSTSERGGVSLTSSTPDDASGKEVTSADFFQSNLLNYTTNRILEIPQDIKLELNDGALTLKAGSKVYALDGSSYTIPSDKTLDYSNTEPHSSWILVKENGEMFDIWTLESVSSISIGSKWVTFGETNCYLPVCVATHNADGTTKTGWKSIDQVFNGFGYIGSTLFLLPGVKTVVPDGRNENGTCKNKAPSTVASVKTETISRAVSAYMFTNFVSSVIATHHYVCSKTKPTVTATTLWYNPETNLPSQVLSDGTVMTPYEEIPIAKFTSDSTGKITSFEPFTVDSVLNSNLSNLSAAGQDVILNFAAQSGNPTGAIIIWSTSTPPEGYLICDGAAISRTTYAHLFNAIGTTWGTGDGSTTFNVPNFVDRYPVGLGTLGTVGTLLGQGLPNITGTCTSYELGTYHGNMQNGALGITQSAERGVSGHGSQAVNINLDASKSNTIYGASDRVQPFSSVVCFCIKY